MSQGPVVHPSLQLHTNNFPVSYSPHHDAIPVPTTKAWHPKLTPYRLAILTTTIGLGTAKAIVTQNGGAIVSTTLEWIAGTLLSLMFFVLSAYESQEDVPSYFSWLFKPDCMVIIWRFLALFSIDRPDYVSEEAPLESFGSGNPDITPYRILVCSSVTAFGLSKAMLGYTNHSTPATWTDWAIAVPITTLLYILGLYEYSSSNILPGFFSRDQSKTLYSVNRGMMYSVGIMLASAWTAFWSYILYQFTTDPQWTFGSLPEDRSVTIQDYFESWQAVGFKLWLQECFFAVIALGLVVLFQLLRPVGNGIIAMFGLSRMVLRVIRRPILRAFRPIFPLVAHDISVQTSNSTRTGWERTKSLLRVFFHVALHMSGVIFFLTFSVVSILAGIVTMFQHSWKEPMVFFIMPTWTILGIMLPFVAYNVWKSMLMNLPAFM